MKKIFNLLLLTIIFATAGFSQNSVLTVNGMVLDELTGLMIPNKLVTTEIQSGGMIITSETYTDDEGFFTDSILTFPQGNAEVTVIDCNGVPQSHSFPFWENNNNLFFDFLICGDSISCMSYYSYFIPPAGVNTVYFTDMSLGGPDSWFWDFGDGNTSTEQNPLHTYASAGEYTVCLTIMSDDSTCYDDYCQLVDLDPSGDCTADFYFETWDNTNFTFYGQSGPLPASTYLWDFGDGYTGIGEVVNHSYTITGMVWVTLTTMTYEPATGDSCIATFEMPIDVSAGNGGDCYNWFIPYTMDYQTFAFEGQGVPDADVYMWDFGDGSTGSGQMVEHTYTDSIPMDYVVTLTTYHNIGGTIDTCMAVSEQIITTGNGFPDCENFFWYEQFNLTFNFHGESFPMPADQYFWNFGDGTTAEGPSVTHIYELGMGDVFTVTLTTVGQSPAGDSCVATSSQQVYINGGGWDCENWFWFETWDNENFTFMGESFPVAADSYFWDFGDGTTGYGQAIDHQFDVTAADQYEVTLTTYVFNPAIGDSCMATSSQMVWVGGNNLDCENMFWYMNLGDFTYEFMGESMPFPADEFYWDFGDGSTGFGPSVTHSFDPSQGDSFVVCLTTFSYDPIGDSCVASSCQEILLGGQSGEQIFGHIVADGSPIDFALVGLFAMEPGGAFTYEFTSTEPGTGSYFFNNVPNGDYYLFAMLTPQSPLFYDYFPTYYGDAIFWFDATVISADSLSNPYDINLVPITSFTSGPGVISGSVTMEDSKGPGDNIMVMLMDADQNPIGYIQTNENGLFEFDNLGYGTYKLTVEMPGVTSEIAVVDINENNEETELAFYVKGTSAYLGVEPQSAISISGDIFPNPASDLVNLELFANKRTEIQINIINQMGQTVYTEVQNLQTGKQRIQIPVADLPAGMYHVQMIESNGSNMIKRFVK
ncbi:MAG TPA: PKD domain-containing protein [Bacteroidales bacterium]|nr:PKD domain-containing protein [Bacteroidales bacterium]HRX95877.1 PKD domain-containing protein [Bacteroidales bacterium]